MFKKVSVHPRKVKVTLTFVLDKDKKEEDMEESMEVDEEPKEKEDWKVVGGKSKSSRSKKSKPSKLSLKNNARSQDLDLKILDTKQQKNANFKKEYRNFPYGCYSDNEDFVNKDVIKDERPKKRKSKTDSSKKETKKKKAETDGERKEIMHTRSKKQELDKAKKIDEDDDDLTPMIKSLSLETKSSKSSKTVEGEFDKKADKSCETTTVKESESKEEIDEPSEKTLHFGFKNPHRLCFLIASCQLLFIIPTFSQYISDHTCKEHADKDDKYIFENVQLLARYFLRSGVASQKKLNAIIRLLGKKVADEKFGLAEEIQHDPAEFITLFIDYLTKLISATNGSKKLDRDLLLTEIKADTIKCKECPHSVTRKGDKLIIYEVAVPEEENKSVQELVAKTLEDSLEFECCRKQELPSSSRMCKLPEIFLVQLKRYKTDGDEKTSKVTTPVEISYNLVLDVFDTEKSRDEEEILESINNNEPQVARQATIYKLKGVVSHFGRNTSCGHYVASVFNEIEQRWLYTSDEEVRVDSSADFDLETSKNCYLLAYRKQN